MRETETDRQTDRGETDRQTESERDGGARERWGSERERDCVCVYVRVCTYRLMKLLQPPHDRCEDMRATLILCRFIFLTGVPEAID